MNDDQGKTWAYSADVVADGNGSFVHQFQLPATFIAVYTVTATGTNNDSATAQFQDDSVLITFPGAATYTPASWATGCASAGFCGTASGGNTGSVRVSVRQGTGNYWNGTSFGSATEQLITTTLTSTGGNNFSWSLAFPITNFPANGSYTVHAQGWTAANKNNPAAPIANDDATVTFTISAQQATTLNVSPATGTYGGDVNLSATLTSGSSGVSGKSVSFTLNGGSVGSATTNASGVATLSTVSLGTINAGTYPTGVAASFTADSSFLGSNGNAALTVNKATSATTVSCPATVTYTGTAQTPCTATATGAGGLNQSLTVTYSNNTSAGTATASASFADDGNHTGSSNSTTFTIAKAASTTSITCPTSVTYDGSAKTPCSATVTGVGGLSQSVPVTYGSNINAGTATANASFAGDANHNASSDSKTFAIDKAASTTAVSCPVSVTYDGSAQTPCTASVTGVGGLSQSVPVTYSGNTNAGTATASATFGGDANHNGSSDSKTFAISKASSNTVVSCPASVVYNGSPQTPCSATVSGAGPLNQPVAVSYSNNTNAGTATATATFAGDANHNGSSDAKTFTISQAGSTTTVSCPSSVTYDGSAKTPCTANVTGAGGLSQILIPTYASNTNAGTASASATFAGDANHTGSSDSKTFTIDKASSTTAVTCPASVTYDGSVQTPCSASVTGAGALNQTLTVNYTSNVDAGQAGADASFAGDANHTGSSDSKQFTINKASSTTTLSCPTSVAYTGLAQTPCTGSVTGAGGLSASVTVTYTGNTDSGTAHASASYAGDPNHNGSSDSTTFAIDKASSTTTVSCPGHVTFTGSAQEPCTAAATGVGGLNQPLTVTYGNNTFAGTASAAASFAGDANHNPSSGSATFEIDKAASVTTVTCPSNVTYDGSAQTPCTANVTGAGGLSQILIPTYASNTNAGTATASASYAGDPNHTGSSDSKTFAIDKASSTTTVTCPASVTYDGSPQAPCSAVVTGAGALNQSLTVNYTSNVDAGQASADASFGGDANHTGSSDSKQFTIAKAASVTTLTCPPSVTYDGSAQTPCTASVSGVGGLSQTLSVSYSNNIDAGTASASASYAGDANHNGSGDSTTFSISKASSTTTVSCPDHVTFTGSAQEPCAAAATGVGGLNQPLTPTYGNNTFAGTASASASFAGDANHNASSNSTTFEITKAPSTTKVTCPANVTYDGSPQAPCTAKATGAGNLEVILVVSYASNTNAGTATASASYVGDANHSGSSDSTTFAIDKASSTTTLTCPTNVTYTGSALTPCSASVSGVGGLSGSVGVDYTDNTNAGTAHASATYTGDANHNGSSDSTTFTIDKASSSTTVTCSAGPFVYSGLPQTPCSAVATGAGDLNQSLTVGYADNTDAGTATASASFAGDANHTGSSDSTTFEIAKAPSQTVVSCLASVVYNGSAQTPCSATVSGAGPLNQSLSVTYSHNTDAGTATASATYAGDPNHSGSSDSTTFAIDKASSTTTVSCPTNVTYTGSALTPCSASVSGVGGLSGSVGVDYTSNTNAGTAHASATYTGDANHNGSNDAKDFTIDKASSTTTLTCSTNVTYTGSALTPCSASVAGVGGLNDSVSVDYASNINAGTAHASATYTGDANHNGSTDSKDFTIDKAPSVTTVTCPAHRTYTGSPIQPCNASATGAGGLNQVLTVHYTSNVDAGGATADASYVGDSNHTYSANSATFTIDPAPSNTVVSCPSSVVYNGSAQTPCSATVSGAGPLNQSLSVTYSHNTDAGTATASASYAGDPNHTGSGDSKTFTINKAASATSVTCPANVTYTGSALTPCSASVTGAGGLVQSLTVNYSNNTNAGTATASASYAGDANHDGSSDSTSFTIDKAASSTVLICPTSMTYTGSPLTPCSATVTGAGGLSDSVTVAYSDNTNAGTASASASFAGDANHEGSSDNKTFTIAKAASVTAVTCPASVTYTGSAQEPCSASVSGAGGLSESRPVTYLNNTNAGTASASASYAGDANHEASSDSTTFEIKKADSATTVTCPASVIYDGSAQTPCSASVSGAGSLSQSLTVDYSGNTNAGTATASASYAGDPNHTGSSDSKTFSIDKAPSTTTVNCPMSVIYDGSAQAPCSASVSGVGGLSQTVTVNYSSNTNAGTATASASYVGDANHNGSSDSKTFAIYKASSTTTVSCATSVTYNGNPQTPCSASVSGAGGLTQPLTVNYSSNTNAGTATASASFAGDANHAGSSDSKTFAIDKASSTTTVSCPASVTYTGSPLTPCSASVTGVGGVSQALTPSYSSNTNAGTASAIATYAGDANHNSSTDSKTFGIDKASSTTAVTCPASVTYNGSPQIPCSASATGVGGLNETLSVSYASNTNAGTATASAAYAGDANHNGSNDSKTFTIAKATPTVNVTWTSWTFDGSPHPAGGSVTGVGSPAENLGTPTFTYYSGPTATGTPLAGPPSGVGQYTVVASYAGSANYTSAQAVATVVGRYRWDGFLQPINDTAHTQTTMSVFKSGSTVPVKFQLKNAAGTPVQAAALPLWVTPVKVGTTSQPVDESVYTDPPTSGLTFRWDATAQQYIYNWQSPKDPGGLYKICAKFDDGQTQCVNIGLK